MGGKVFMTLLLGVASAATRNPPPCMVPHVVSDHRILFGADAPLRYAPSPAQKQIAIDIVEALHVPLVKKVAECWSHT